MKFKIGKKTLLDGLSKVQGITGRKSNIPMTSNVLISTTENKIMILATDLEIAFQGKYEAEILAEGATAVPSRKLYEIVRDFPSDVVSVSETENKWIKIVDESIEYNIVGMDTDDFPGLPDVEGAELFEIDNDALKNIIEKTMYSVLADEGRAHLAGVFFEMTGAEQGRRLRMVSTDGHRLSRIDEPIKEGQRFELKEGVIVPKGGMVEVLRLLEEKKDVQLGFKDNNLIVNKDAEKLVIRLVEGEFPDYDLVIPKTNKAEVRVGREALLLMLKRMSILSSDKYRSVHFKVAKKTLEATTRNPDLGESREVMPVQYKGGDIEIAFNPRYFIEALSTMKSDEVIIKLNDETTPCVLEGENDPGFLSVIMPMRI